MTPNHHLHRRCTWLLAAVIGVVWLLAAPAARAADDTGFVHRQGTQIVDGSGTPIRLRGVNVGNWLMWENWMMGARGASSAGQTRMLATLASLVGTARAQRFAADVTAAYVTEDDVRRIAAQGFDVIRVPFNHSVLEGAAAPAGWAALDGIVGWARDAGVHVVLDMHAAPGGQSPYFISDPDGPAAGLWLRPDNRRRTVALWTAIAARYRDEPAIAGYDLLNEPFPPSPETLTAFYAQLATAIRTVDPNHLLFLEGGTFARDTSVFTTRIDENSALSIHQYLWGTGTPELDLLAARADARRLDLPLWVGEMGNDTPEGIAAQIARFDGDPAFSGWAGWSWKTAVQVNGNRSLNGFEPTPAWQATVDWMAGTARARPTRLEAERGLADYVRLIGSATPNPAVADAYAFDEPTGLTATYFDDPWQLRPALTRTDAEVDFDWRLGSAAAGLPADRFSVRWTGTVNPVATGPTTFTTTADDSVRVWIGGKLIIDDRGGGGARSAAGVADLTAGVPQPVVIEYVERTWNASIRFSWRPPGRLTTVVPSARLRPG